MTLLLGALFLFLLMGVPIAYSLGLASFVYFLAVHPELIQVIPQ